VTKPSRAEKHPRQLYHMEQRQVLGANSASSSSKIGLRTAAGDVDGLQSPLSIMEHSALTMLMRQTARIGASVTRRAVATAVVATVPVLSLSFATKAAAAEAAPAVSCELADVAPGRLVGADGSPMVGPDGNSASASIG
jgi:hypothetical protein